MMNDNFDSTPNRYYLSVEFFSQLTEWEPVQSFQNRGKMDDDTIVKMIDDHDVNRPFITKIGQTALVMVTQNRR